MKILFEKTFAKDLNKIKDKKILKKLKIIIEEGSSANSLPEIQRIKKLKGIDNFYRIKIGDYRVGIELLHDTLIFTRLLHRKDIYK